MHCAQQFFHSLIPSCFHCIERHQDIFSLSLRLSCRLNQSGKIWRSDHLTLLWALRILNTIVLLYIRFNNRRAIVLAVILIILIPISLKRIFGVRNSFSCAIIITLDWMTVDSPYKVNTKYLNSSSRVVLCGLRLWQRWSFWQCDCSLTIMLKEWTGCVDNLLHVRNVFYGGHLLVSSMRFHLCSTQVLAALLHLQNVMNIGHSVQFPFLRLFLHFQVIFCVHGIQFWVSASQNPVIGLSELPYNDFCAKGLTCGFWLPLANTIGAKGKTGLQSNTMQNVRWYVACHIGEIGVLWVHFLLLAPTLGYVQYPMCSATHHWLGVVIIEIWINLSPVLWCFRRWFQIELGGSQ